MDKKDIYLTGGQFNRRKIVSYSNKTRPTSQKVRLAVFNQLFKVYGTGLDLFAGSGAYSFEALSRGIDFMYINDFDYLSIKAIKENAKTLDVLNKVEITKLNYKRALEYYEENNIKFDFCFIDPPYDFTDAELTNILNWLNKTQKKDLKVVVERNSASSPLIIPGLNLSSTKTYGTKNIFVYLKE